MQKNKEVLIHIAFWIVIMLVFSISGWGHTDTFMEALKYELLVLPARLIAVYLNWFIFVPRFLYKNKLLQFAFYLGLCIVTLAVIQRFYALYWAYPLVFPQWANPNANPLDFSKVLQNAMIITSPVAFTTGFKLFRNWYKQRKRSEALEQEKIEAELKYLKSQTNPHFLFNTLNSIYGLALEKSDKVPKLILKLSDFLSYTLYESSAARIPLEKEILIIQDFIDLEKERYGKRVTVSFLIHGNPNPISIAPLILIPFVENAFKHGVRDELENAWIKIELNCSENKLFFSVINSKAESEMNQRVKNGLGLKNISRRLDLIYGKEQQLKVENNSELYKVVLQLNLID